MEHKIRIKDGKIIWDWWGETKWWLRRRDNDLFGWMIWIIDRLPWFARKPLFNWIVPELRWGNFHATDKLLRGERIACIKW